MVGMSESRSLPSLTSTILDLFHNLFYKHTTDIKYSPFNLLQSIKQIRDLKVAKEEQDIGFYAGFVGEQCLLLHDWDFKAHQFHRNVYIFYSHKVACISISNSLASTYII
jgi:hypothetical protein